MVCLVSLPPNGHFIQLTLSFFSFIDKLVHTAQVPVGCMAAFKSVEPSEHAKQALTSLRGGSLIGMTGLFEDLFG